MKYDLIIIGSGPAGLTAAVYAARYKLNTLILGKLPGGLAGSAHEVCNFPSYKKVGGFELMNKMIQQVKDFEIEIKQEEVLEMSGENNNFEVQTRKGKYQAKKIIMATGSQRRKLDLEREQEFLGKGLSYCATCDAAFYKEKTVAVIGGSDAALTAALLLSKFAPKVYLIYRQEKFVRAEPAWVEEVEKNERIEVLFNSTIVKLLGEEQLTGLELNNGDELEVNGLFVEIGSVPNSVLATEMGIDLEKEEIKVDKHQKTNVNGILAAGDLTNNPLKQIITACSQGATAVYTAYHEIQKDK